MGRASSRIDNLSKVSLELEAGTSQGAFDLTPGPVPFEFIFGIGSSGLTPLEFHLAGRFEGEEVVIPVGRWEAGGLFGVTPPPTGRWTAGHETFYLKARILRVAAAQTREVIRAMADLAACGGCGGDCCGDAH